jgi:hypothetical protein
MGVHCIYVVTLWVAFDVDVSVPWWYLAFPLYYVPEAMLGVHLWRRFCGHDYSTSDKRNDCDGHGGVGA